MTTDRYAALRAAIAAGPTPGRRFKGRSPHAYCVYDRECWFAPDGSRHGETPNLVVTVSPEDAEADAALIAAADPDTLSALLAERDALRSAVTGLLDALPSATTHPAVAAARTALRLGETK